MTKFALTSLVLLTLIGASSAEAAPLKADSTVILSGTSSLLAPLPAPVSHSFAGPGAVDQTGRFVAFASDSDGLSGDDNDGVENVYVKDRLSGAVTLASRRTGAAGTPATQDCDQPAISDNGQRVAFSCEGPLDAADTNSTHDIYVRDLTTNETSLVSRATGAGAVGDGDSESPALNEDGTRIVYESDSNNLGGTTDSSDQVYMRVISAIGADQTLLVSRGDGAAGNLPNASSENPSITDDGTIVAFESDATNLVATDPGPHDHVYVRLLSTGTTRLESRAAGPNGAPGNGDSRSAAISGDGKVVIFMSRATNLAAGDTTDDNDVFERAVAADGGLLLVDQVAGVKANAAAVFPSVDDTGAAVSFLSQATNLDPADKSPGFDTFVARPGSMTLVSRADGPTAPAADSGSPFAGTASVSGDGKEVLFGTEGSVTGDATPGVLTLSMRDLAANTTDSVARPGTSGRFDNQGGDATAAVLSADGRYAAFMSSAPALGVPTNIVRGIVVRDTVTGATFFASRADGAKGAPMNDAFTPTISANGRRVAFADGSNIWVRDLLTGSTVLASRANGAAGAPANAGTFNPSISADGNRVEFLTTATNLGDGDTDALADVHVRDLKANTTLLADRADGAAGAKANADVLSAALSGDGTHVAFSTEATNLGDGDADNQEDVHVRDLSKGTTRLASVSSGGTKANKPASGASIDGDGTHVAFVSAATNLASTTLAANESQVWVRDVPGSKTVLASRATGANGAPGAKASFNAALSADGHVVAFTSASDNLAPSPGGSQLYRRDLDGATTRLVSRASGANGAAVKRNVDFAGGISANGACLSFGADGDLLGAVPGSLDFRQSYMRVLQADCGGRSSTSFGTFDKTAPVLRSAKLSHKRFRVAKKRTALSARKKSRIARGTVLRFTSSEASKLSVVVERVQTRRKGRKVRTRKVATLTRTIKVGSGRISFTGRLGKRRLAAGTYRLTLTARDSAANVSKPVSLRFTIVAG